MNKIILTLALFITGVSVFSQNVGINTTGVAGHASAMLDVDATDKGILIPRVSIGNVSLAAPITSPATGLMVYNTNVATTGGLGAGYYYWTGAAWAKLLSSNAGVLSIAGTTNQVLVANVGGNYTLSTPQDIHTGANTTFNSVTAPNDFFGRINIEDTRATDALPATYGREVHFEFKQRATISSPGAGTYGGLMTMAPWSDASGGSHHQLFFNNGGIFHRTGAVGSGWNGWGELVTSSAANKNWTMSAQMNFSPDDFGTASIFPNNTDDARSVQTMPFSVTIEGVSYNQVTICTNGWIAFGDVNSTTFGSTTLPASFTDNPVIFPFWTDMQDYGDGEYISVRSDGAAPNRIYHVRFRMRGRCATNIVAEFQVQIHETSNLINVKYNTMNPSLNGQQWSCDGTKNTTIGFQLHGGASAKAFPISYNSKVLDDNAPNTEGFSVCPIK